MFVTEQTSRVHVSQPTTSSVDCHAPHCRHLRRRRRVRWQRQCPLWAWVPAAVRRTEGRQLLQRRWQRLRLRRGPAVPARIDDNDDGDWLWPRTTSGFIRTSQPPTNCHNGRLSSRVIPPRWDVARWCRFTNNAPYVIAAIELAPVTPGM